MNLDTAIRYYVNYIKKRLNFHHPVLFRLRTFPGVMQIETTNYCNMKCIMCPRAYMKRPLAHMDAAFFEKIAKQLKGYTKLLLLHGFGDPLLCPDIYKIIGLCRKYGLKSGLSTNPVSLTDINRKKIFESGLDELIISLDAASASTYKKIRGADVFEQSLKNIETFLKEKKVLRLKRPGITISLIDMGFNKEEIGQAARFWKKTGQVKILIKEYITWDGSYVSINNLVAEEELRRRGCRRKYPCIEPWDKVAVLSNGLVVPCCVDSEGKYVLGDLNKQTLEQIWQGEAMGKLRGEHREKIFEEGHLCKSCIRDCRQQARKFYPLDIPWVQLMIFVKSKLKKISFFTVQESTQ